MAWLTALVVPASIVNRDSVRGSAKGQQLALENSPVVPKSTGFWRPLESKLDINVSLIYIEEVVEDQVTLCLVEADDPSGERSVDEQRFPAGSWVDLSSIRHLCTLEKRKTTTYPHNGMYSFNMFRSLF